MATRAAPVQRAHQPLVPRAPLLVLTKDGAQVFEATKINFESVGGKAYGLASLPEVWRKPLFVVQSGVTPSPETLNEALRCVGIEPSVRLIVRSSGAKDSMSSRGDLVSVACLTGDLAGELGRLQSAHNPHSAPVHWVVQELISVRAKGHLSNERRVAEDKRDWLAEVEASINHPIESSRISLRTWRDNRTPNEDVLDCNYKEMYVANLKRVARWAYERLIRVHFEWVWDGHNVILVQADLCEDVEGGRQPEELVQLPPKQRVAPSDLKVFRVALETDFQRYRKLANARMYVDLGYQAVPFYVLDNQDVLTALFDSGQCSAELQHDLNLLGVRPLIIRTDGLSIPDELKQMLPRSEELRSSEQARNWLQDEFRVKAVSNSEMSVSSLADCSLCLIAHHFIPAVASAWCQAHPDQRRVRIESLWGIPEGLYWHAYDVFDVDTQISTITSNAQKPDGMTFREKRRYKEHFIAPDAEGKWVLHRSAAGPDWQRSIKRTDWIEEIAWSSRLIAAKAGHPVVVMWFVGVPNSVSAHHVMPWYHEQWTSDRPPNKAVPRRKFALSSDFVLQNRSDWTALKERLLRGEQIARITVQPTEPEIVRDPDFAAALARLAIKHRLVVELEGGILSHAYYMLSRAGCTVECIDLDDYATDDYELEFNKLVRDGIPDAIASRGESVSVLKLEGEALITALRRKLVEETLEVLDARNTDEIVEELADVREVMLSLMGRLAISETDVESRRKLKEKKRGAFERALMLTKTNVAPPTMLANLESGASNTQQISGTITRAIEIPQAFQEVHLDRRFDAAGGVERQFTADLPVHASGYSPAKMVFDLPTVAGADHEMVLDLSLEREGADLRLRARLRNAAVQLQLDFDKG